MTIPVDGGTSPDTRLDFEGLIVDASASLISAAPEAIEPVVNAALERLRVFLWRRPRWAAPRRGRRVTGQTALLRLRSGRRAAASGL
jgi:hypothetical protein